MGSDFLNWQDRANALFFVKKMSIVEISKRIGISRKSISNYLKLQSDYNKEKDNRKLINCLKRKEYKKEWDRNNRYSVVNDRTLRHEHDLAAYILSRERH